MFMTVQNHCHELFFLGNSGSLDWPFRCPWFPVNLSLYCIHRDVKNMGSMLEIPVVAYRVFDFTDDLDQIFDQRDLLRHRIRLNDTTVKMEKIDGTTD